MKSARDTVQYITSIKKCIFDKFILRIACNSTKYCIFASPFKKGLQNPRMEQNNIADVAQLARARDL